MSDSKPKLAVIGTGIAGLSSAWLLKNLYDVTVYESQARAGMGVHTIDYVSNGIENRIDIPLRIFCRGYYDNLLALYKEIGVEVLASDHAGIFTGGDGKVILHYGNADFGFGNFTYLKGRNILNSHAWKIGWKSHQFFNRATRDIANRGDLKDLNFGEYLQDAGADQDFVDTILLPMMSVTCTCDYQTVRDYPADIILEYLTCGVHELGIMSAANGVDDIVPRLLTDVDLRTSCAVAKIEKGDASIDITTIHGDTEIFDQVIVAAQAQQAAMMLSGFDEQKNLLQTVPFESSEMSVHTDTEILPDTVSDVSPVSYHLPTGSNRAEVSVDLVKAIPRLNKQQTVFQTWNPIQPIAANKELARVKFTRPAVTRESRAAIGKLRDYQLQRNNRLWFCGSYMADKIPLLEAAVDSSVAIAEKLGAVIPWKTKAL